MIQTMYYISSILFVVVLIMFIFAVFLRTRPDDVYRCSDCFEITLYGTCTSHNCIDRHKYNNPKYIQKRRVS